MTLKSISLDQLPGWNDPYRSRNREPDFLAFLDKRLAFVSLKMRPLTGDSD